MSYLRLHIIGRNTKNTLFKNMMYLKIRVYVFVECDWPKGKYAHTWKIPSCLVDWHLAKIPKCKNFTLVEAAAEKWHLGENLIDEPLRTSCEEMELSLKTLNLGLKTLFNKIEALIWNGRENFSNQSSNISTTITCNFPIQCYVHVRTLV